MLEIAHDGVVAALIAQRRTQLVKCLFDQPALLAEQFVEAALARNQIESQPVTTRLRLGRSG